MHYYTLSIYLHTHTANNIAYRKYTHAKRNFTTVWCMPCYWFLQCGIANAHHEHKTTTMTEKKKKQGWKFQFEWDSSAVKAFDITTNTMAQHARIHTHTVFHLHPITGKLDTHTWETHSVSLNWRTAWKCNACACTNVSHHVSRKTNRGCVNNAPPMVFDVLFCSEKANQKWLIFMSSLRQVYFYCLPG